MIEAVEMDVTGWCKRQCGGLRWQDAGEGGDRNGGGVGDEQTGSGGRVDVKQVGESRRRAAKRKEQRRRNNAYQKKNW